MLNYEIRDKNGNIVALAMTYTEALETADALSRANNVILEVCYNGSSVYETTTVQTLFG